MKKRTSSPRVELLKKGMTEYGTRAVDYYPPVKWALDQGYMERQKRSEGSFAFGSGALKTTSKGIDLLLTEGWITQEEASAALERELGKK